MTTHTRLPRDTGRDHDDVGTSECLGKTTIRGEESFNFGRGSNMGKVDSHARSVYNIIER